MIGVSDNWCNTHRMTTCDLLVIARWMLPIAPENCILHNHAVAITNGAIVDLGTAKDVQARVSPNETVDLNDHIVLPGLVNAHGHAAMTLLRGAGEDQSLQAWLSDTIWPLEAQHVNADFVRLGTEVALAEMIASGTTTFSDMYFFPEDCADLVANVGMRAQICFPVIEMSNVWSDGVIDGLHKGLALHDNYRHHERIDIAFGPHAAYTVSATNLEKVAMYANEIDAQVQIHMHENAAEVQAAQALHGKTWIQALKEIELLGPNLQTVHMTHVSEEDLATIASSQTSVIHCPVSNLKLASGYAPIDKFIEANVQVGLGTDGAASNNTLDLFHEAQTASLIAKHERRDPTAGNARDTLRMATLGGAQALGLDRKIGSLEIGKQADFIAIDASNLNLMPHYDPFAALIHGSAGRNVSHSFVRGQALLDDRTHTSIDVSALTEKVRQWQITAV